LPKTEDKLELKKEIKIKFDFQEPPKDIQHLIVRFSTTAPCGIVSPWLDDTLINADRIAQQGT